ncbi:MAG: tetratricopeptide repeat protein [Acidobacteriota bacterium]
MRALPQFDDLEVLREIGRGGMGVVYLAERRVDGAQLALKTVRVPEARLLGSIRREILTLSRLAHPGIVGIVAHGVKDGMPWYAMPFERGTTLRARLEDRPSSTAIVTGAPRAPDETAAGSPTGAAIPTVHAATGGSIALAAAGHPLPLAEAITIVRGLCAPLSYLHGEGLVHRDLKPENVVLRRDGTPVIVDFGLATDLGTAREDVDGASDPSGTALYMAPEQWVGSFVDARVDIYALGCILYELLTGRPPFYGESSLELARKHAATPALPPSAVVTSVPAELDRLVARMIAKRPKDRVGHAQDVARVLETLGARGDAGRSPRARAYLYRADLAGRGDLLAAIALRLRDVHEGGRFIVLSGESGVGKTRLALGAIDEARRMRIPALAGRCEPRDAVLLRPFRPVLVAAADRCRERGPEETARLLDPGGRRAQTLGLFEPALLALPGVDRREPERLPADEARDRLFREFADLLEALAAARPLLVVIDDLQWADEVSVALCAWLCRTGRLARMPVMLLATQRAEEDVPEIEALDGLPRCERLDVALLDGGAMASIVSDMLALPEPPAGLAPLLLERADGNPFFLAEYLRALVHGGHMCRDEQGRWEASSITAATLDALAVRSTLLDLVATRLLALPEAAHRVLDAAAVLGRDVDVAILEQALGARPDDLAEPLWDLARRHLLTELEPGTLRFDHDKIREAALARLPPDLGRDLHARAARAIAAARGADPEAQAEIGRHWAEAGEADRARPCLLAGARRAAGAGALAEAERLFVSYLELAGENSVERAQVRNELGSQVLGPQGRSREERAVHELALAEATELRDRPAIASSLELLGGCLRSEGLPDEAEKTLKDALAIYRELGDGRGEAQVLRALGQVEDHRGRLHEAEALHRKVLAIHRASGSKTDECRSSLVLSMLLGRRGKLAESEELVDAALAIARGLGSRRDLAVALAVRAMAHDAQGRIPEARGAFEEANTLFRETGDRRNEVAASINLAGIHVEEERAEEAIPILSRALEIVTEMSDRPALVVVERNLGVCRVEQGDFGEARRLLERALSGSREVRSRRDEGMTLLCLATLERLSGDLDRAGELLGEGERVMTEVGDAHFLIYFTIARGHYELARGRSASSLLADARFRADALGAAPARRFALSLRKLEAAAIVDSMMKAGGVASTGTALVRGEAPALMPEGLRRALCQAPGDRLPSSR